MQLLQLLKNSPREVKWANFRYILVPRVPRRKWNEWDPEGKVSPGPPRFLQSCTRDSAWINVRFGSAQASDQLKTRLEARDSARLCSETQIDISSRGGRAYRALDFQVSIVKSSHWHLLQHMFEMFCNVKEPSKLAAWKWAYVS